MRPTKVILFGAVATLLASSQIPAWAEHHEGTQTISGRIMPLHEFFSQSQGSANAASSVRSPSRSDATTRPGDASDLSGIRRDGNTSRPQSALGASSSTPQTANPTRTPTPGVSTGALTSAEKANDRSPGDYSSSLNESKDGALGSWSGQPLVLIASTPASRVGTDRKDPLSPQTQGNTAGQPSSIAGLASATHIVAGQAYLLVCDPQDRTTMAALAAVGDNRSFVSGKENAAGTPADLEQRRLRDRADELSRDRDSSGNVNRLGRDSTANRESHNSLGATMTHSEVKVTGKLMQRGGLQAIEVVSITRADGSNLKDTDSSKREEGLKDPASKKVD